MTRSIVFVSMLALASTAHVKTISAEELRPDFRSALSLASETELLIDQIEGGRRLAPVRKGHADYLREEAHRQATELPDGRSDDGSAPLCAEQLDRLAAELKPIRTQSGETIGEARAQVEAIRKTLAAAGAGR
jgi:hypothetical protein